MLVYTLAAAAGVPSIVACDVFAIRCNDDDDCPNDVPFCVDDICVTEEEAERRGRDVDEPREGEGEAGEGEGEGPATCASDFECSNGLCYNFSDESGRFGTCVPDPSLDEDCQSLIGSQARASAGPAIFDVVLQNEISGCRAITLRYLDREGDVNSASPFLLVGYGGSGEQASATITGDGTNGVLAFTICPPEGASLGIQLFDDLELPSNTACQHPGI